MGTVKIVRSKCRSVLFFETNKENTDLLLQAICKMSESEINPEPKVPVGDGEGGKSSKPSCHVCFESKTVRDDCIMGRGEENCKELIEAHKKCLQDLGLDLGSWKHHH